VAFVAIVDKDRANPGFEEFLLVLAQWLCLRAAGLRQGRRSKGKAADCSEAPQGNGAAVEPIQKRDHAIIPFTISPKLSVNRKSRPL